MPMYTIRPAVKGRHRSTHLVLEGASYAQCGFPMSKLSPYSHQEGRRLCKACQARSL
jgi:hypothetical protein